MTPERLGPDGEHLLRELAPQVLGALMRRFGDFAAAEDAVQEALLAASVHWPRAGMPDNPRGWLIQVAARRMTDHVRSEQARRRREEAAARDVPLYIPAVDEPAASDQDDTLILLFMCCHPALTPPTAIALTLRAVGGLTTAAIASAFLVPESTMAQRISRAKQSIKSSGVPFGCPITPTLDPLYFRPRLSPSAGGVQNCKPRPPAEFRPPLAVTGWSSASATAPWERCMKPSTQTSGGALPSG